MSHQSDLIRTDIGGYLRQHEEKDLLRVLTCGSVDDGKSTLIGRLLHDSNLIYEDQLAALRQDSARRGSVDNDLELAWLLDGLKAEREQGITIDVAYRYFSTARRKFIIADSPGHEQYTRNMVTGASTCDLAVILIDARRGVLPQTKRHSFLVSLLGIRQVAVVVNKMDLVDWSRERYEEIRDLYLELAETLPRPVNAWFAPISALTGDGVVRMGEATPWFEGPTLLEYLETVSIEEPSAASDFRFPVQLVSRPSHAFRGYQGTVGGGVVRRGDRVMALPSGAVTTVDGIVTFDGDLETAELGRAVTLTLTDEIDISRGDLIVHPDNPPSRGHDLDAMLVWMSDESMVPGKEYLFQQATRSVSASISSLHHRIDIDTLGPIPAPSLGLNEIGRVTISCAQEVWFDSYDRNRTTGAFILVDRHSNATLGAGMVVEASTWNTAADEHLRRHVSEIGAHERGARYGQSPCTVLLTGLSGAGKSTIAIGLERRLFDRGRAVVRLDGEDVRLGMSRDLGFSAQDRSENLRRSAEIARLANEAGLIVIAAFAAPEARVRRLVRELIGPGRFMEIHCDAPVDVCRARDQQHLYEAADRGEIVHFPGVSAGYDVPASPDLRLDTQADDVGTCVERIVELLAERGYLSPPRGDDGGETAEADAD